MTEAPFAPIALFAYRRLDHLTRTLDALEACDGFDRTPVFIFSDAGKDAAGAADVAAVRAMIRCRLRPHMTLIEAPANRGLAASIIAGVGDLCSRFGRVIVIEDDLILQPSALVWFNQGLDAFESDDSVFQVCGYQHRVEAFRSRRVGMMLPFTSSWGWATWARAWKHFDAAATGAAEVFATSPVRKAFDIGDSFPMSDMLGSQLAGRLDSWAIRWYLTSYRAGAVSLFPPRSLVENIGFDESATHNNLGRLKRLLRQPRPYVWSEASPPGLPGETTVDPADARAHRRALRATGAMRNAKIKRLLRRFGVWKGH